MGQSLAVDLGRGQPGEQVLTRVGPPGGEQVGEVAGHLGGHRGEPLGGSSGQVRRAADGVAHGQDGVSPGLEPRPTDARHCWVTALPWSHDGIAVWEADGLIALAGNNLFKHAPVLGQALARAAVGEGLREELRPHTRLGLPPAGRSLP